MKKIMTVLASVFCAAALYANANIFVVDIDQVHNAYYKTKIAIDNLKASAAPAETELARLKKEAEPIAAQVKEVEKKLSNDALTDEAKKEINTKERIPLLQKLATLDNQAKELINSTNVNIAKQRQDILALHLQEIIAEVKKIAEAKKADFVVEKKVCYFSNPTADITEEVITALNANAPKK